MELIYPISGFSDPFSSLSHLLGAGLFLIMALKLLNAGKGDIGRMSALLVFCLSGLLLLSMSGVYHLLEHGSTGRYVLQILDHSAIFIMIVATITPIHQMMFKGFMCWAWLLMVWTIAITGLTLKSIYFAQFPEWLSLSLYLLLGWSGAITGGLMWYKYGFKFIQPLLWGGIAYSIGAILEFIGQPILISGVIGAHELFHICVLIGLSCHWLFIYRCIQRQSR